MSIEFHCDHCGRLIRTANEHAGKRGKCPHCKNSVYIPTPSDEIEPLKLAPINPEEEREKQRQLEEARRVAERLRADKEVPSADVSGPTFSEPMGDIRLQPDMETLVIEYALCMANGKLSEAEEYAVDIRANMARAEEVIQRLTMDDLPPLKLTKIPHPVLVGLLRQLRESK